ncbi:dATP/dGTP diphosphohydrolase domain-containing protein [Falsochrobactrum ovis]|uniref:dATP/dGTP diphosphohydrolase N-terminal domain-containing protein n=1 Tax=Falsochrobactrum ovis TaxID=1293442 RepID=A0A364JX58_9HYPH|nr:dATP/dGTP diphosphohydrolase domain-containing protein [Falsochrobactrum ovis]RAK31047.1 hypothetical protein C7374_103186 [Falsochrobactrum ovis]
MSEGKQLDDGKVRMDLLPPKFLFATADILGFGAGKYGDRNWEKGMFEASVRSPHAAYVGMVAERAA